MKPSSGLHAYYPPQFDDVRSPCPALNALANHGYLPHDGKNIGVFTAVRVLREVYNLSWLFAIILTLAACYCSKSVMFNLSDLCQHNVLEHDGSLAHADATGTVAPAEPDPARLASFLSASSNGADMTLDEICRVRHARDLAVKLKPMSRLHRRIAFGELALTYLAFARADGTMSVDDLRFWFGRDRLPDSWVPPSKCVSVLTADRTVVEMMKKTATFAKGT